MSLGYLGCHWSSAPDPESSSSFHGPDLPSAPTGYSGSHWLPLRWHSSEAEGCGGVYTSACEYTGSGRGTGPTAEGRSFRPEGGGRTAFGAETENRVTGEKGRRERAQSQRQEQSCILCQVEFRSKSESWCQKWNLKTVASRIWENNVSSAWRDMIYNAMSPSNYL